MALMPAAIAGHLGQFWNGVKKYSQGSPVKASNGAPLARHVPAPKFSTPAVPQFSLNSLGLGRRKK